MDSLMSLNRVLCRYYLEGTCRYGQACTFSHDLQDTPSMVCKYWAAGFCKYGDKCRYDHKHPHRAPRAAPKPAATSGTAPSPEPGAPGLGSEPPASHALLASLPLDPFETDAGQGAEPGAAAVVDDDAMDGLGGWEEEGPAHLRECGARHDRLAARQAAARLECAICLERVLGKAEAGARRFGLLACDHVFCLACIRSWRQEGEVDVDTALRTCPVCRQTAFFVTPSTVWPESAEQKQAIVEGYRAKLASIDCMHFDKGRGACPFGASCHYKHAYEDGTVEVPSNRLAADEEGEVRMLQPMRLSDFITITDRRSRRR
ncbi:E3 ubiquitin-protein ligase makorin [Auxenochlorella protothecoides]|uniref:E3 ubiquitin-protein ligase makorin n=1 Tax=Auxenochlorella protothecoides TaxID=3075 RepID=A0A087SS46_AUXPR|nr:E3 ubiquitin-protein ligase makorin [Auxenochlorella protothecoides]KFM28550.1 E3 ubiquitin-protein ligase makorin [Auxenochlorella protothecoides]